MEKLSLNELISNDLERSAETISKVDPAMIEAIADAIISSIKNGGQVFFMGNGGSSADAQHLAAELSGRYLLERPAMPGSCFSNIAPVTAIGNDYSYDKVFERQVDAFVRSGDVIVGISTSGNSKNVILALERAKEKGAVTVSMTGPKGTIKDIVDYALTIPSSETPRIQEAYLVAGHTICGLVERGMYGKKAVFIDRDDTIAKDVPYCDSPEKMTLFDGVPGAISKLNKAGYLVIMITNQSGISRGLFSEDMLCSIHKRMMELIETGGGRIDDIFYCPHHPDECCSCRKPEVGMGVQAILKYGINTKESFMIGDTDKDMEFGRRIGCRSLRVTSERSFGDIVDEIIAGKV